MSGTRSLAAASCIWASAPSIARTWPSISMICSQTDPTLGHYRRLAAPPGHQGCAGAAGFPLHRRHPRCLRAPRRASSAPSSMCSTPIPSATISSPCMADPRIRIVSLTVTEKGYCHDPATGELDPNHPDIVHDLANPDAPISAPGLHRSRARTAPAAGIAPFTVMSCDNLPSNGETAYRIVTALRRAARPGARPVDQARRCRSLAPWSTASCPPPPMPTGRSSRTGPAPKTPGRS